MPGGQELGQWDKKSEAAHTSSFQEEFEEKIIVLAYRASHGITIDSGPRARHFLPP